MTAPVPIRPVIIMPDQILSGRAVRGPSWEDIVLNTHFSLGRGSQLVPAGSPISASLDAAVEYVWSFRARPRYQTYRRLWIINARCDTADGSDSLTVDTPTGSGTETYSIQGSARLSRPILHFETPASQSDAETTLTIAMTSAADSWWLDSVQCVELPRTSLSVSGLLSDLGYDVEKTHPGAPIYADSSGTDNGTYRLATALDAMADIGRRVGHFMWAVPTSRAGVSIDTFAKSTAAAAPGDDVFLVRPSLLARPGSVLTFRAMARVSAAATTGEIKVTMDSGDTSTASVSSTSWTVVNGNSTLVVDEEDQTEADGKPSGADDDALVQIYRTAGAGDVLVAGIYIHET